MNTGNNKWYDFSASLKTECLIKTHPVVLSNSKASLEGSTWSRTTSKYGISLTWIVKLIVFRIYILDSNKDLISEKQITFFSFGDLRGILVISLEWFPTFPLSLANQIHKNFNHLSMFNPLTTAQPWSVERFARGSCLGKFLRIDDDDVRVIVMDYDDDLCGYLMITCGQRNTFY